MWLLFDENIPPAIVEGLKILTATINNKEEIAINSIQALKKTGASDDEVYGLAGKNNGVIITYDKDFKHQRNLRGVYTEYAVGVFFIKQPHGAPRFWDLVKIIVSHWEKILKISKEEDKPFIYEVSKNGPSERSF